MRRRQFLLHASTPAAGISLAGILPLELISAQRKIISPNDKLGFALIGCKGMGWTNMARHFQVDGVECVALCDQKDKAGGCPKAESSLNGIPARWACGHGHAHQSMACP